LENQANLYEFLALKEGQLALEWS